MDDADFLRALAKDPHDTSLRAIYADWLEEQGDLRGEYLRLEQEIEVASARDPQVKDPQTAALEGRLRTLLPKIDEIDKHWLPKAGLRFDLILFTDPMPRWMQAVESVVSFFSGRAASVSTFSIRSKALWHEVDDLRSRLRGMLPTVGEIDRSFRLQILPASSVEADGTIDLGEILSRSPIRVTEGTSELKSET